MQQIKTSPMLIRAILCSPLSTSRSCHSVSSWYLIWPFLLGGQPIYFNLGSRLPIFPYFTLHSFHRHRRYCCHYCHCRDHRLIFPTTRSYLSRPALTSAFTPLSNIMVNFAFLGGPPDAIAVLNADPILFVDLLVVIVGLIILTFLAWFIHYRTSKNNGTYTPWFKQLKKAEEGKGGRGRK